MSTPQRRTRGKSRPGRLRLLDPVWAQERSRVGEGSVAVAVDLGIGAEPWTTLEWRLPGWRIVAVDSETERVESARRAGVEALVGGFALPLGGVRIVRMMNVLRQYPAAERLPAVHIVGEALVEDGLLVEGSSDKGGAVVAARCWRRRGPLLTEEAVVLATDFSRGFAPRIFQRWLPVVHHGLLEAWSARWEQVRQLGASEAFERSAPGRPLAAGVRWLALGDSGEGGS